MLHGTNQIFHSLHVNGWQRLPHSDGVDVSDAAVLWVNRLRLVHGGREVERGVLARIHTTKTHTHTTKVIKIVMIIK